MKRYACIVAYSGRAYCGWQSQTRGDSVQEKLEFALHKVSHERISIIGAGRTDAGVNAWGQTFHFDTELEMSPYKWKGAINGYLPEDIHVREVKEVSRLFHARYCVRAKQYDYRINLGEYDVFSRYNAFQCPYPLDVAKMEAASKCLIGTHDFTSFNSTPLSVTPDQVRSIYSITFEQVGPILTIHYYGKGFLRYMVRMLTGELLEVGRGRQEPEEIQRMLVAANKTVAHHNAHAEGLTLKEIQYFEVLALSANWMIRDYVEGDTLPTGYTLADLDQECDHYCLADRHTGRSVGQVRLAQNKFVEMTNLETMEESERAELLTQLEQTLSKRD